MHGRFRRDLELVPGPELRLRRRLGPRLLSAAVPALALAWDAWVLWAGLRVIGLLQLALASVLVLQFVQGELEDWRFEGDHVLLRNFDLRRLAVRTERLRLRQIRTLHVEISGRRARAWLEARGGEQYALVEGPEAEVRALTKQIAETVQLAQLERRPDLLN